MTTITIRGLNRLLEGVRGLGNLKFPLPKEIDLKIIAQICVKIKKTIYFILLLFRNYLLDIFWDKRGDFLFPKVCLDLDEQTLNLRTIDERRKEKWETTKGVYSYLF